ncbi:M48 family metalloprotease, partial [Candidatus Woesearchaeota archaeon]|nr:M48 family metalloprotease [Candidatus Woesearchaeota archaeon]
TNRDILISTVAACIATAISYIALFVRFGAIFGGMGGDRDNMLELLALAFLAPLMAMLIQLAISRSREYLADETSAKNLKNSNGLASALAKMQEATKFLGMKKTGQTSATAHMFIVNPFRGANMLSIFSTHPPTNKRIERLRSLNL